MKIFLIFAMILAMVFSSFADTSYASSPDKFTPQFSTNTAIIWQAPTNNLPQSFWIYKRLPPRPFLASVISNAVVLASLQDRGFPKASTNAFYILSVPDPCGVMSSIFSIQPASTTISFSSTNRNNSTEGIPSDAAIVMRAWNCAFQFALDSKHLMLKGLTSHFNLDTNGDKLPNQICGRGVYLSRQLDGICFWGNGDDSPNEGFWIEFGSYGQIRSFSLNWPNLERDKNQQTASPQQIVNCIKAYKTIVLPNADEEAYFKRVKTLANAKTFTITKITPYYCEGIIGEAPTNDVPPEFVTPFAELEAVADFGNSNATVKLLSPIISSEVSRLLAK
jgi:hypothetical protein